MCYFDSQRVRRTPLCGASPPTAKSFSCSSPVPHRREQCRSAIGLPTDPTAAVIWGDQAQGDQPPGLSRRRALRACAGDAPAPAGRGQPAPRLALGVGKILGLDIDLRCLMTYRRVSPSGPRAGNRGVPAQPPRRTPHHRSDDYPAGITAPSRLFSPTFEMVAHRKRRGCRRLIRTHPRKPRVGQPGSENDAIDLHQQQCNASSAARLLLTIATP